MGYTNSTIHPSAWSGLASDENGASDEKMETVLTTQHQQQHQHRQRREGEESMHGDDHEDYDEDEEEQHARNRSNSTDDEGEGNHEVDLHTVSTSMTGAAERKDRDRGDDETATVRSLDSATVHSSPAMTPLHGNEDDHEDDDEEVLHAGGRGGVVVHVAPPLLLNPDSTTGGHVIGLNPRLPYHAHMHSHSVTGTPSTVSTAPSTDEASLVEVDSMTMERLALKMDASLYAATDVMRQQQPYQHSHRGEPSWEVAPHHLQQQQQAMQQQQQFLLQDSSSDLTQQHPSFGGRHPQLPPAFVPQSQQQHSAWGQQHTVHHLQQRVATFRVEQQQQEMESPRFGFPPMIPSENRWHVQQQLQQQQQQQQQARFSDPNQQQQHVPFLAARGGGASLFRPAQPNALNPYPIQQQGQRKPSGYNQSSLPPATPPRGGTAGPVGPSAPASSNANRNLRLATGALSPHRAAAVGQSPHRASQGGGGGGGGGGGSMTATREGGHTGTGGGGGGGGNARSSSEILKTLLRKKACLYEPETSRAVALVTWLVGRELALEYGFFSRQQLQAGVHACVSEKIDSGAITRTKVNRCMQIILNSCFHYIIPRPDGTEEKGDSFRALFSSEAKDDSFLLRRLQAPWNDLTIDREVIMGASAVVDDAPPETPLKAGSGHNKKQSSSAQSSAHSTPVSSPHLGSTPHPSESKLSPGKESNDGADGDSKRAVLLCFNENVRCADDVFRCHNEFIRDTAHASHLQLSSQEWRLFFGSEASNAPFLWGNFGLPGGSHSTDHSQQVHLLMSSVPKQHMDALGMMTGKELEKFRTSWCAKRYDHDHELCGFAHVEMNGGWLRRNPNLYSYNDESCPFIVSLTDKRIGGGGNKVFILNECPHGVNCKFAHSMEEILYHPRRYKNKTCPSMSRPGGCHTGDVCPHFHPADQYRFSKKSDGRSSTRHNRPSHAGGGSKSGGGGLHHQPPAASPIMYASPAPISSFEQHLALPGLQGLFRRHCSVLRAHLRHPGGKCMCTYSYFGDDDDISMSVPVAPENTGSTGSVAPSPRHASSPSSTSPKPQRTQGLPQIVRT